MTAHNVIRLPLDTTVFDRLNAHQRHGTQFNPPWHDPDFRASQSQAMRDGWARKTANV